MPGYTREQLDNFRRIKGTPEYKAASPKERKALFEATSVESNHKDLNYGDRDSLGILQQRNNGAWGAAKESVEKDVGQFLAVARTKNATGKYGSAGSLAQAVQGSAFPERYQQRSGEADKIIGDDRGAATPTKVTTTPGRAPKLNPGGSETDTKGAVTAALLGRKPGQSLTKAILENVQSGDYTTETKATVTPGKVGTSKVSTAAAPAKSTGNGTFKIDGPDPKRLKPELLSFAEKVAAEFGGKLIGKDGSSHSKLTVNGNVSEHFTGNATDIFSIGGKPASGATLIKAGRAALIAAGMPRAQAMKAGGGLYNVGRHQIIFATNEGGNHFDHLHISTHAGHG